MKKAERLRTEHQAIYAELLTLPMGDAYRETLERLQAKSREIKAEAERQEAANPPPPTPVEVTPRAPVKTQGSLFD